MNELLKVFTIHLSSNQFGDDKGNPYAVEVEVVPPPSDCKRVELPYDPKAVKDISTFSALVDLAKAEGYDALAVNPADALIYSSHPEIALPGAWTKLELQNELDHARDLGLDVYPMLNFSAAHDIWMGEYAYMVSTPDYYKLCADLIEELCELFEAPPYFYLGLNEEAGKTQLYLNYSVVRGDKLMIHDMDFFMKECRKHKATPWLSSDFAIEYLHLLESAIPKDAILSQSVELPSEKKPSPSLQAFLAAQKLGYSRLMPTLSAYFGEELLNHTVKALPSCMGFVADGFLRATAENRRALERELRLCMKAFSAAWEGGKA